MLGKRLLMFAETIIYKFSQSGNGFFFIFAFGSYDYLSTAGHADARYRNDVFPSTVCPLAV